MAGVDLVPVYLAGRESLLEHLASAVQDTLHLPVRFRRPWFDPEKAFDLSRGQYNSTVLIRLLLDDPDSRASRVLAVTGVDLFIPVLTYVFGEAQVNGRAAVVSIERLRSEAYGLPSDEGLLSGRLRKEAIHELGHTFGLLHCRNPECVMRASTYVEEIDLKSHAFCDVCLRVVAAQSADRTASSGRSRA